MAEVGNASIAIFPTFKGFRSKVGSEAGNAGRESGKTFSSAFNSGAGDPAQALIKKLNAQVASGASALSKARMAEQDAAGKVRAAEVALTEARSKGGAESSRAVAAEERLASAQRNVAAASLRTKTASDSLRASQSKLAEATAAAGASGAEGASRYATGWASLKQKLSGMVRGAVDDAGDSAKAAADSAGRESGSRFASGFKGVMGPALALAGSIGFAGLIAEAAKASDATDKFKATMNFAGLDTSAITDATNAAKDYADQTVYDLPTIQNMIAQLASNGVKDYTGLTKAAGNLNAVAGGNADTFKSVAMVMTQTAGAGKLSTENWNQMADAIPGAAGPLMKALEQAGAYTGNFRDAMSAGEITADEFNDALMKLGNDPIAVEAAKSTATFEGALGNLEATINSGLMSALNALKPTITGVITLISNGLGSAFAWIGKSVTGLSDLLVRGDFSSALREAFHVEEDSGLVNFLFNARDAALAVAGGFRAFGAAWRDNNGDVTSDGFAGVMERMASLARQALTVVKTVWAGFKMPPELAASFGDKLNPLLALGQSFKGVVDQVVQGAKTLAAGFKMPMDVAAQFGDNLNPLLMVGVKVRETFSTVGTVLSGIWSVIGPQIAALVPQVFQLFSALSPTSLLFQALLPVLPQIATAIGSVMQAVLPLVLSLTSQLMPIITQLVSAVLPPLISIFSDVVTAIAPLITQITAILIPVIQALMPVVVTVFSVIASVIASAMQIVQGIIQVVTGIISGDWSKVWAGIQNIFSGIWNTIVSLVRGALQIVGQVVISGLGLVGNFVRSTLDGVGRFFADTWNNVTRGVGGFIDGFMRFFYDLPGRIQGALSGAASWLLGIGQNVVQGLINGITGMAGTVARAILNLVPEAIRGPIEAALGIHSPSRVAMWWGEMIGDGLSDGIDGSQRKVASSMDSLVSVPDVTAAAGAPAAGLGRGQVNNITINQVDDPIGTSTAVARRLRAVSV